MISHVRDASLNRLAGILEGYLREKKWATEKRLEGDVYKSHSVDELRKVMDGQNFSSRTLESPYF